MNDRRSPFEMFEEMERMFEQMRRDMWSGVGRGMDSVREFGSDTNISVEPTDDGYVVLADLPGFEKEEIDLRFDDGVLSLRASHEVEGEGISRSRKVSESVRIPGDVIVDGIDATYRNGVLEVTLPVEGAMEDEDDAHRIDID